MENFTITSIFSWLLPNGNEDISTILPSEIESVETSPTVNEESWTSSMPRLAYIGTFFSWYDYVIFTAMLSFSFCIGTYFGFFGKQQTTKDYLHAGGNMHVIPVLISLLASECGRSILAIASEVYMHGANYLLSIISLNIVSLITMYVYLPVFYKLKLNSVYEYLDLRFDEKTRKFSAILYSVKVIVYLPIILYASAILFSTASGLDKNIIIPVVGGICIFYTAAGGLKGLIWSDIVLFLWTFGALLAVLVLGVNKVGGIANVFKLASKGERMFKIDFGLDLTKRDHLWAILIGFTVEYISLKNIHQRIVPRYLAVPTFKKAKLLVFLYCSPAMSFLKTLCALIGLTIYANFSKCDPLTAKRISHNNELLPYYVLNVAGNIPCLSGLIIAGIFCTTLSSFSSNLTSAATTVYEDLVKPKLSEKHQRNSTAFLRLFVVMIGVLTAALAYTVEYFEGLFSLTLKISSIAQGPLLGLFTLGFLFPRATSNGAFYGASSSAIFMIILVLGSQYFSDIIKTTPKPVSTEDCFHYSNYTNSTTSQYFTNTTPISILKTENIPIYVQIFSISFYWFCAIGVLICIIVALTISYLSKENDPPVARELLSPIIYGIIDKNKYVNRMHLDYCRIDEAISRIGENVIDNRSKTREEVKEEII